jgi:hypothetical protein
VSKPFPPPQDPSTFSCKLIIWTKCNTCRQLGMIEWLKLQAWVGNLNIHN